jgi:RNA polymerase sigma-70 factor, ECF subfamily
LIERHAGILHKISRAYCPIPALRTDLIQEMTVALWRSFDRYDPSRAFSTWMYRIALNVAISFFRREDRYARRHAPIEHATTAVERPPEDARVARLLECLDELEPLDKALVVLHLDGYPYAEIGDILGITTSNAGTKLGRIKERLRRNMTAPPIEQGDNLGTR